MTDEPSHEPLPASVSEYMIEYPGATPAQIIASLDLDAQYRAKLAYYCAVTRYTLFRDEDGCELPEEVHLKTVTWADVADWEMPAEDCHLPHLSSKDIVAGVFVCRPSREKLRLYLHLITRSTYSEQQSRSGSRSSSR